MAKQRHEVVDEITLYLNERVKEINQEISEVDENSSIYDYLDGIREAYGHLVIKLGSDYR